MFVYLSNLLLMKKQSSFFFLVVSLLSVLPTLHAQRMQTLFDAEWKFFKGDVTDGEKENINDKDWRT